MAAAARVLVHVPNMQGELQCVLDGLPDGYHPGLWNPHLMLVGLLLIMCYPPRTFNAPIHPQRISNSKQALSGDRLRDHANNAHVYQTCNEL